MLKQVNTAYTVCSGEGLPRKQCSNTGWREMRGRRNWVSNCHGGLQSPRKTVQKGASESTGCLVSLLTYNSEQISTLLQTPEVCLQQPGLLQTHRPPPSLAVYALAMTPVLPLNVPHSLPLLIPPSFLPSFSSSFSCPSSAAPQGSPLMFREGDNNGKEEFTNCTSVTTYKREAPNCLRQLLQHESYECQKLCIIYKITFLHF